MLSFKQACLLALLVTASLSRPVWMAEVEQTVDGHSGYVRINDEGDDIFYWMVNAKQSPDTAPVLFWFQGGPGATSMLGMFWEIGPVIVEDGQPAVNAEAWNLKYNLVFVDQPAGTGFGHSSRSDMPHTASKLQAEGRAFFKGFLDLHPQLAGRPMYITGESYGGHHVPYLGEVMFELQKTDARFNLQGLAIGNGWVHASKMYKSFAPYLLRKGLLNQTEHDRLEPLVATCA